MNDSQLQPLKSALSKGEPGPLYFFYGDEALLIDEAVKLVRERALSAGLSDFNHSAVNAREVSAGELLNLANTMPMLGGRRFVRVKDFQAYSTKDLEQLADYAASPNPQTTVVITGEKADVRRKFFKLIKQAGGLHKFTRPYQNKIPEWVAERAREMGLTIRREAAQLLGEVVGNDLLALHQTLDQLAVYLGGAGEITQAVVEELVARVKVNTIFELCDAIGERNRGEVLKLLGNILENRIAPLQILSMIVRHYRQLWRVKEMSQRRLTQQEIATAVGVHPFFVKSIVAQQRRFSEEELTSAFTHLLITDYKLKSSPLKASVLMEELMFKLCSSGR